MSQIIFFLTKLNDPSEREKYEEWVRETDIPAARKLKGIQNYRVVRLNGPVLEGVSDPSYDYIEIIEVDDVKTYQSALKDVDPDILDQFMGFIGEMEVVQGDSVEG